MTCCALKEEVGGRSTIYAQPRRTQARAGEAGLASDEAAGHPHCLAEERPRPGGQEQDQEATSRGSAGAGRVNSPGGRIPPEPFGKAPQLPVNYIDCEVFAGFAR